MIPGDHVVCVVGFQEVVAAEMSQDPGADRVLAALQEERGEGGGFVEAEAGVRVAGIGARITLDLFEEAVHDAEVIVEVRIQRGAEAVQETDRADGGGGWSRGTGLPQRGLESTEQDVKDGAGGSRAVVEEGPEAFGHGEHDLAHGHVGNDVLDQVGRRLGHALGVTGRAGPPALAGKRDPVALHLSCTGYNVGFD